MPTLTDPERAMLRAAADACTMLQTHAQSDQHEIALSALDHARIGLGRLLLARLDGGYHTAADRAGLQQRAHGNLASVLALREALDRIAQLPHAWYRLRNPQQGRQAALWVLALATQVERTARGLGAAANIYRAEATIDACLGEDFHAAAGQLALSIDAILAEDAAQEAA